MLPSRGFRLSRNTLVEKLFLRPKCKHHQQLYSSHTCGYTGLPARVRYWSIYLELIDVLLQRLEPHCALRAIADYSQLMSIVRAWEAEGDERGPGSSCTTMCGTRMPLETREGGSSRMRLLEVFADAAFSRLWMDATKMNRRRREVSRNLSCLLVAAKNTATACHSLS